MVTLCMRLTSLILVPLSTPQRLIYRTCEDCRGAVTPMDTKEPARLHCPWVYPGKNTKVGCHFPLQGIFLTQGSNLHLHLLLHWQVDSLPLSHLGLCMFYQKIMKLYI